MPWHTYILLCDRKSFYVGLTSNLESRLQSHRNKQNIGTKEFEEVKLVYREIYPNRREAEKREKQIKGWTRAKKNALVQRDINLLKKLSKSRSVTNV